MFGKRLRMLRERKGFTKKKMSEELQMPYTTYLHYEDGTNQPNNEVLVKIAEYFEISIDWLLDYKPKNKNSPVINKQWEVFEKKLNLFSIEELNKLDSYIEFLIWERTHKKKWREGQGLGSAFLVLPVLALEVRQGTLAFLWCFWLVFASRP